MLLGIVFYGLVNNNIQTFGSGVPSERNRLPFDETEDFCPFRHNLQLSFPENDRCLSKTDYLQVYNRME